MLLEMVVSGLAMDPVNNAPIVIVREKDGTRVVPIWIGVVEASAIAFELEEVKLERPLTHDLLKTTIEALGGTVLRVAVVDLRDNTYFAVIVIEKGGETIEIDARPSDAIAVALRCRAPVLCESDVVDRAHVREESIGQNEEGDTLPESDVHEVPSPPPIPQREDEDEDGQGGPRPIINIEGATPEELLESLTPEDFGKYKM